MKKSTTSLAILAAMLLSLTVSCGNEKGAGSDTTIAPQSGDTSAPVEESPFVAD